MASGAIRRFPAYEKMHRSRLRFCSALAIRLIQIAPKLYKCIYRNEKFNLQRDRYDAIDMGSRSLAFSPFYEKRCYVGLHRAPMTHSFLTVGEHAKATIKIIHADLCTQNNAPAVHLI